ncbi:MAG: AAA domain-containing protein, partial [Bacillota bacterium]|nr:AAA domain-containing protein [Bacillota bacterium]
MQQVLNKYKDRLINISSRNRSLVMKKLYKKNSFDFQSLSRFTTGIDSAILEFLLGRRLSKIRLLPDKNAYEEQLAGEYREQIDNKFWEGKKLLLQTVFDSVELSAKERELREKCDRELDEKLEIGRKQADEISEIFGSINYLNREINAIEKETGRYELYAGYPFVEGHFKDGTFVKGPLLLFPVRLLREGDNWLIDNIEEQYILLNKVFLMAFEKYNEIRLKELETEFYDLKETQIDTAEGLLKYLGDAGISIKAGSGRRIERFQEFSEADEAVYRPGELSAKNYLVLGRFPIANNSIYNDYTALEKEKIQNKLLDKLLLNSDKEQSIQTGREVEAGGIREEDFYFMTPLDYSQEKALKSVNGTEQLVIYGPPGTGKSQTIANMISDGLAKGRKILMVSQKRAALDVIYNRISNLSSKVVIIHDSEKDKKAFYMKTAGLLEETGSRDVSDLMARIKEKSVRIDEDIKILDKLGELLHREREFGLTLQQMYVKSVKIASKEDPRFEDFKIFRERRQLKGIEYSKISNTVESALKNGVAEAYCQFRQYIKANSLITRLKGNLDSFDIEETAEKIEQCCREFNDYVKLEVPYNNHADRLLKLFGDQQEKVTDNLITALAVRINEEENRLLLV